MCATQITAEEFRSFFYEFLEARTLSPSHFIRAKTVFNRFGWYGNAVSDALIAALAREERLGILARGWYVEPLLDILEVHYSNHLSIQRYHLLEEPATSEWNSTDDLFAGIDTMLEKVRCW